MLSREERKKQNDVKRERRLAEEQLATEEAKKKGLEARVMQRELENKEREMQAAGKKSSAKRRLEEKAERRALWEAKLRDKEEDKRAKEAYRQNHPGFYNPNLRIHSVLAIALALLALFITFSFIFRGKAGSVGNSIADFLLGCFSYMAYLIPLFMMVHAALWRKDVRNRALVPKALCFIPVLLLSAALAAVASPSFNESAFSAGEAYLAGQMLSGGGAVGGAIGYALHRAFGIVGLILFAVIFYLLFGGLYFFDLLKALYKRTHMAIKAAMIERAKQREAARAERAAQKKQQALARQEEKAAQRIEKREEAALRREERRAALREKQQALPAPPTPATDEQKNELPPPKKESRHRAGEKEEVPPVSIRDRISFAADPVDGQPHREEPRRLPDVLQDEIAEESRPMTTRERRRALFADLEEDGQDPAAAPHAPAAPAHPSAPAPTRQGGSTTPKHAKPLFDFDNMPIEDAAQHAPAAPQGTPAGTAKPFGDPMRDKTAADLSADPLTMTKESVDPRLVTPEEEPEKTEKEPKDRAEALRGKLLHRSMRAPAPKEPEEEEDTAENDMRYFRRITTSAGQQTTPEPELPFSHPEIHPMPPRGVTEKEEQEETAVPDEIPLITNVQPDEPEEDDDEGEEEPLVPPMRVPRASENPFHPQNNPQYSGAAQKKPLEYNGVQDARVFAPPSATPTPPPVQQQITMPPARPTPPPKPPYQYPPISLLVPPDPENEGNIKAEIQTNAEKLVSTLDSFKVHTRVTGYSRGPRITRYEVVPDAGIRVAKISALVEDISLNLATSGIRIEAPIPGKSAVGIEVPNANSILVRLRAMLDSDKFRSHPEKTFVCLGGDVTGQPVYCDLAKMPHLLVAGATGMGKSVCINSIILSLLYKATPDEVKLIMIDPKMVEFNIYSGIPHLLVPVVTDPKKAAGALSWAVNEMERRYALIKQANVRGIKDYNRYVAETGDGEILPKVIIIIDELADLMLSAKEAVETSIARLTAKARAAGIHLLIGTQRPSVDVITGTIKSNIPSRIAFHVASQVDSRTILDSTGAEKLLTNGDMLFVAAGKEPLRVQGAFVEDQEIARVVEFLKANNETDDEKGEEIMADIEREAEKCVPQKKGDSDMESGGGTNIPTDDDDQHMLWAALQVGFEFKKISTSLLQRKLSIGYGKAAKILDTLEDQGFISPQEGSKPRKISITYEEFKEMMARDVHEKTNGNF